ncbi:SPASM domain-containing protein [Planctomycetota bacterium]
MSSLLTGRTKGAVRARRGHHHATVSADAPAQEPEAAADGDWSILEPPQLTLRGLLDDLRRVWSVELQEIPPYTRVMCLGLRVLQHVAYRRGYGTDRVAARLPLAPLKRFESMERNLAHIPADARMDWLFAFLRHVNDPRASSPVGRPRSVMLELSANCNLNCVGCGRGRAGISGSRFMPVSRLRHYAALTCDAVELIRINGHGEATLHPRLTECLRILRHYPGGREIITNGTAPLRIYQQLLDDGFALLVSWDAADYQLFQRIRRGAEFESLVATLREVCAHAIRLRLPGPVLLFTMRRDNVTQLPGVLQIAAEVGARGVTVNMFKRPDNTDWTLPFRDSIEEVFVASSERAAALGIDLALPDHLGARRLALKDTHASPAHTGCRFPWEQVMVRHDGEVTPCNMLNPYSYGNIEHRGLEQVWNGPEAGAFRELTNARMPHPYCVDCYYVDVSVRPMPPASGLTMEAPLVGAGAR